MIITGYVCSIIRVSTVDISREREIKLDVLRMYYKVENPVCEKIETSEGHIGLLSTVCSYHRSYIIIKRLLLYITIVVRRKI